MRQKRAKRIFAIFIMLLVCLVGIAAVSRPIWKTWRGDLFGAAKTYAETHTQQTTADTLNWQTPENPLSTLGNQQVLGRVLFDSLGATVGISVGLYHEYPEGTYLWVSSTEEITVTADSTWFHDTLYVSTVDVIFDTRAAPIFDMRITTAPSEGGVNINPLPFGGNSPE